MNQTYIMSDIHGNLKRFYSVLLQINLEPSDRIYVLGDIVDRHPHGIQILLELMEMPNAYMLLGNHEYMLLEVLGTPSPSFSALDRWYRNGGKVTHQAFLNLQKNKRERVIDYLQSCCPFNTDICVNGIRYRLVHAAPLDWFSDLQHPEYRLMYKDVGEFAVWHRFPAYSYPRPNDPNEIIIFGHTPTEFLQRFPADSREPFRIFHGENVIGIDCGSGYPDNSRGRLACLRLDDMKEFYSEM